MNLKKMMAVLLAGVALATVVYAAAGDIWTLTGKGSRRNTVEFQVTSPTVGTAANFVPGTTNTNALGTSSLKWSDVQTTNLTVAGTLTAAAVTVSGGFVVPTVDIAVTSPTVVGALIKTSAYVVYIATNTTDLNGWVKVGGQ